MNGAALRTGGVQKVDTGAYLRREYGTGSVHVHSVEPGTHLQRDYGFDLAESIVGGGGHSGACPGTHHARAKYERCDLCLCEFEWWHIELTAKCVAYADLALNRHTRELQIAYVAVDGAR